MYMIVCLFGFGFSLEGIEDGKVYIGTYTPQAEYGWVVQNGEIWLDVVVEKNEKKVEKGVDTGR
jgi:hypothetical protein